jgi:hypothetical protein
VRPEGDPDPVPFCDECGQPIYQGAKSLAGVGIACSREHLDALAAKHEAAMRKVNA